MEVINSSSTIVKKDYEEYNNDSQSNIKRGVKVVEEAEVEPNIEASEEDINTKMQEAEAELQSLIDSIETKETKQTEPIEEVEESAPKTEEATIVEEPIVEEQEDDSTEEIETKEVEETEEEIQEESEETIVETPIEEVVEEPTTVEEIPVATEETTPVVAEETIQEIDDPTPVVEEEIIAPSEETPVVPETPASIDEQIDEMIQTAKTEVEEETQPLDIDAMFAKQPVVEEATPVVAEPTEENKLAIDSIFNVETDQIEEDEDASNEEHLAEDFDQYINTLENKEA